jgi:hypothetical protein
MQGMSRSTSPRAAGLLIVADHVAFIARWYY